MPSPVAGKAPKLDTQIKDGVDFFGKGRGNARVGKGVQETSKCCRGTRKTINRESRRLQLWWF